MKKIYSAIILLVTILVCCKKYNSIKDDAIGDSYIRGRLFLYDTLTKNITGEPLSYKTIQLSYNDSRDSINYLLSVVTDKDGYFTFKNLNKDSSYRVYYEEKNDTDIIYVAERTTIKPPFDTLVLNAFLNSDKEAGLHYTIKDSSGTAIKGASVCVFNNASFFTPGLCTNCNYSLATDPNGHAFVFNIPSITYYVTAYIQVNGSKYLMNDTLNVGNIINYRTLYLNRVKQTGYHITVIDSLHTVVPGVQLCFFSSEVAYNTGNCSASNFQNSTDSNGSVTKGDITPGIYYILANIKLDSLSLFGRDTIDILKDNIANDTIVLTKK